MRLWNRHDAPVGGWYYILEDGTRIPQKGTTTSLPKLADMVADYLEANGKVVPEYLEEEVEDQICMRQPDGKCRYTKKAGDMLSAAITGAAGMVDRALGTNLKQKARRCGSCGRRRVRMNQL